MSQLAHNACISCFSHKRGCDRLVPSCSRCSRLNILCRYEQSTKAPQQFSGLWSIDGSGLQDSDLDQLLTSRLFNTLTILNIDLDELINAYLQSVHQWVPLIQSSTLREQAATLKDTPLAELATFVRQLLLVVPPSPFPSLLDPHLFRWLYHGSREAFSLLQAHRRDRLLTIQSGIVIAIYEQSQRLYSDAYVSLSACASLGYVMGLDTITDPKDPLFQEKKFAWQAIYFADIINKLSFERCSRPELIPVYDILTNHSTSRGHPSDPTNSSLSEENSSTFGSASRFNHIDRQTQAIQILQSVLRLTRNKDVHLEMLLDYEAWKLDLSIQKGIRDAIDIPQNRLERQYALVVIFLLSTFELHKKRLICLKNQQGSVEIEKISVAALESALNVTQDMLHMDEEARILDARIFHEGMMPITVVMLMQEAASTATLLESEYQLKTRLVFQLAIRSLRAASSRWTVADMIAMELETSQAQIIARNDSGS